MKPIYRKSLIIIIMCLNIFFHGVSIQFLQSLHERNLLSSCFGVWNRRPKEIKWLVFDSKFSAMKPPCLSLTRFLPVPGVVAPLLRSDAVPSSFHLPHAHIHGLLSGYMPETLH